MANYLDQQSPEPGSDLANVITQLRQVEDAEQLNDDLDQLHPALFTAFDLSLENMATRLRYLISDRAYQLFYERCGCSCREAARGFWVDAVGDFENQENEDDNLGYHSKSAGTLIGVDHQVCRNWTVGAFGGYSHTDINWRRHGTSGSSNGWDLGAYTAGTLSCFEIDGSFTVGYNRLHSDRHIDTTGFFEENEIIRTAHRSSSSWLFDAHLGVGYPLAFSCFTLTPYGLLDYVQNDQEKFKEHGAESLNFIVQRHQGNLLRGEGGVRLYTCLKSCHYRWLPSLSLSAVQEWRWRGKRFTAALESAEGTFTVSGLNPSRTLFSPDVELMILPECSGLSFTLGYNAEIGKKLFNQNGYARVGYDF